MERDQRVASLWGAWRQRWTRQGIEQKTSSVAPLLATTTAGRPVWTPRDYGNLSAEGYAKNVIVYRCVSLISRGASSVPWLLYDHDQELDTHPLLTLLNCSSPKQSGSTFIEAILAYLLLAGNAYIEAVCNAQGEPVELYPLRPDRMTVVPDVRGMPMAYEYRVNGMTRRIAADPIEGQSTVLHLKHFHPLNDWYGLSPLEVAAQAIDQHNAVAAHNLYLLQNGGRPSGALQYKSPQGLTLSESQRQQLRQDLKALYEGSSNSGRMMVLEGDFEWKEMGLSPKDLDFIEGKYL